MARLGLIAIGATVFTVTAVTFAATGALPFALMVAAAATFGTVAVVAGAIYTANQFTEQATHEQMADVREIEVEENLNKNALDQENQGKQDEIASQYASMLQRLQNLETDLEQLQQVESESGRKALADKIALLQQEVSESSGLNHPTMVM